MTTATILSFLVLDTRGSRGRLAFLVLCLAVGVAAVVAVAALADALDERVRGDAKQILGGDVAVSSAQPLPDSLTAEASTVGGTVSRLEELVTMAAIPGTDGGSGRSQLVELKVVDDAYPLYGEARLRDGRPVSEGLAEGGAVVAPDLLPRLGLAVGDPIRIGELTIPVAGVVASEPDRAVSPFQLGPRVFLSRDLFPETDLEQRGSRITRRLLLRLPGNPGRDTVDAVANRLGEASGRSPGVRVHTYAQAQENLTQGLRRVERFLGLVALLSLLVGGIGVAQTIRSFLASRMDALAILKCLGLRPREAFGLYLGECLILGLVGSLLGGLLGLAIQQQVPRLLGDLLPPASLPFWQPAALARGLILGLGTSLVFAVPPLTAILRVPPLRALRRSAEPMPPSRPVVALLFVGLVGGILVLATVQGGSAALGLRFTGALLAAVLVLAAAAAGLRRLAGTLRRSRGPLWLRQGAALVAAPSSDTLPALVALGIGVLVVLSTFLIQRHLSESLAAELPRDAPTAFLLDVQPDQWPGVRSLLAREGATSIDSVPVVMARLASLEGRSVEELADEVGDDDDRRWALTREQRLTYLDELPPDNEIVAGAWFAPATPNEASLEVEFARELGVGIGSTLVFDVQGVPVEVTVTSLRRVDWRTFRINFFLVTDPETLEAAPQTILAAARLPRGREQEIQDLVTERYSNVTLIDVRGVLEKVAGIFRRLSVGIRFLGLFTALAGLVILFGAVAAGSVHRSREVALLKTLGFTRGGVGSVFSAAFGLLGLVAGLVGAAGATVLTWIVVTRGFELEWRPFPGSTGLAVVLAVALTLGAGLAASARALARRPIEVLREERE